MILEKLQIFQVLLKKLKFLREFLQNFILCQEISGGPKIDFRRDYRQILKKHIRKYFTRTIREV